MHRLPGRSAAAVLLLAAPPAAQLTLVDVAEAADADTATFGRGAAMVDLDGDGRLDLVAANAGMDNAFLRQKAGHEFQDANALWGVAPDKRQTWSVVAADLDNDGDLDVFFGNGGFGPPEPNQLLRNDLATGGQLVDVSAAAGDLPGLDRTFGACAVDLDEDGLLDLVTTAHFGACRVLLHAGGLVFADTPAMLPGHVEERHRHCGAGDFDNDGAIDVGVGVKNGENLLLRNTGPGGLVDVAGPAGVASDGENFGFVLSDLDQDGWLDVYLPKYQVFPTTTSKLFVNQQDGTFLDVSAGSGITGQDDMGHDVGDLDNDGYLELYIGTGNPQYVAYDVLFAIEPDGAGGLTATDLSDSSGIKSVGLTRNHGMALGDYDEDGDVDVYSSLGGPSDLPESLSENVLWRNAGNANAWVEVALEGLISNRGGVGARTTAVLASGREVHVHHQAGRGFGNTPSPIQHLGLGAESAIERIEVRWPSGIVQSLPAPQALARHEVLETGLVLDGVPAIGGSFDLAACGPAGDVVSLAFGPNPGALPLLGLGTFLLAPPIFTGPTFALGADGRASLPVQVPSQPSLSGQSLLVQAWIHPAAPVIEGTLTNAVKVAFP